MKLKAIKLLQKSSKKMKKKWEPLVPGYYKTIRTFRGIHYVILVTEKSFEYQVSNNKMSNIFQVFQNF